MFVEKKITKQQEKLFNYYILPIKISGFHDAIGLSPLNRYNLFSVTTDWFLSSEQLLNAGIDRVFTFTSKTLPFISSAPFMLIS